jgi:hypothetical protein
LVSRLAKQQVTVALSADAGDEVFCGYQSYFKLDNYLKKLNTVPSIAGKSFSSLLKLFEETSAVNSSKVYHQALKAMQSSNLNELHKSAFLFQAMAEKPKGYIDNFAVFSKALTEDEIENISENNKIENKDSLKLHYNSNHIKNYQLVDLSGNNNDGSIVNCDIVDLDLEEYKKVKIPHRRDSTFYTLSHEENGFFDNKWKTQATRWNQLRFHNEVSINSDLIFGDGLSDLEFVEHGLTKENNITHINVGI